MQSNTTGSNIQICLNTLSDDFALNFVFTSRPEVFLMFSSLCVGKEEIQEDGHRIITVTQ